MYGGISTGEFTITWKHWQAECRSKLGSRLLMQQPQLELIMRVSLYLITYVVKKVIFLKLFHNL